MSVASKIFDTFSPIRSDIRSALVNKGNISASSHNFGDFAEDILAITAGTNIGWDSAIIKIIARAGALVKLDGPNGLSNIVLTEHYYTEDDSQYTYFVESKDFGQWTITVTDSKGTVSKSISVAEQNIYTESMYYINELELFNYNNGFLVPMGLYNGLFRSGLPGYCVFNQEQKSDYWIFESQKRSGYTSGGCCTLLSVTPINVTNYSSLEIKGQIISDTGDQKTACCIGLWNTTSFESYIDGINRVAFAGFDYDHKYSGEELPAVIKNPTIDVSNITGAYHIGFALSHYQIENILRSTIILNSIVLK